MGCGRRYAVVILCFIGLVLSIGSREVFSIVITHVIKGTHENSSASYCIPPTDPRNLQKDWDTEYVFSFQTLYFVGYIITQLPGGILAAKFSPRRVFGVCILLTSVLTIVIRFAIQYNAWLVFLIRFVQGIIEGPIIPALNGVLSQWALKSEKSKFVTTAYAGAYLSAGVAGLTTGKLICYVSWGSGLFIYGGLGLLWSVFWLWFVDASPAKCTGMSEEERQLFREESNHTPHSHRDTSREVPWKKIFTSLPLSAIFVAAFCRNWIFTLLLTQIPEYFKDVYKMHADEYSVWSSIPHLFMTVVVISGGVFVDRMIKKKIVSTTVARKAAETIGFGVESGCIMALGFVDDKNTAIVLLCVGVAVSGIAISGYQTNPLDLAPQYVSVMTGVIRLATIASVLSTVVAVQYPAKKQTPESWHTVFIIAASIHLFGVVYYLIFASGERQHWAIERDLERSVTAAPTTRQMPRYGAVDTQRNGHGLLDAVSDEDDDDEESLFTRSLHVEGLSCSDDEEEGPAWLFSTI